MDTLKIITRLVGGPSLPRPLPADPFPLLCDWLADAMRAGATPNPEAMTLATVGADGAPAARIVLCKAIDPSAGSLTFYTNYTSRKGAHLHANPRAAAVFHWDAAGRQARIRGSVERLSAQESDAYFATRPALSRIGAWASRQSQPLESREQFVRQMLDAMHQLDLSPLQLMLASEQHVDIPRPPHWGGFRLVASSVELWVGAEGRLHDRAEWSRDPGRGTSPASPWTAQLLQP